MSTPIVFPLRRRALLGASAIAAAALMTAACSSSPEATSPRSTTSAAPNRRATPSELPPETAREAPPPSGPTREFRLPRAAWSELSSGLKLGTVESRGLPIVQIRVVVLGGSSADGERPGLAGLTAELLKDGGAGTMSGAEVPARIESLGASLSVNTAPDRTSFGVTVTKDQMAEALDLLGAIVARPQMNQAEFTKLKKRAADRAATNAQEDGQWGASMILWRDLFTLPTDRHPYASYDATAADIGRLTAADCRAFHARVYVPRNTFVVVIGDAKPEDVKAAAERAFGGYRGGEPPVVSFTEPVPPESRRITLVHRPRSVQSDIYVGFLGPMPADPSFPGLAVTNAVLGSKGAGRLFLDLREKQSLAYVARSAIEELAGGSAVLYAHAATQTPKTGLAVKALLDHVERIGREAPSEQEVETASRYLADALAIKLETTGDIADAIVKLRTLGLPDDYYDTYWRELRAMTPAIASKAAGEYVRAGHEVIVVAGEEQVVGPMLSRFGDVKVVDPTRGFERIRSISMNADAPLEAPAGASK